MEADILKQSNRSEWSAVLHNLCYCHAAIQLRARFGFGGWNLPHEFLSIGFRELQVLATLWDDYLISYSIIGPMT